MNKENSDTYSVTCQCPRLLVFVLAVALVFGAVCVGGVSGAVTVTDWTGLNNAISNTPVGGSVEIIIGTASSGNIQIDINSNTRQLNIKGKTVTISNYPGVNVVFMKSGDSNDLNIFEIGSVVENGNTYTGSLTLNGVIPGSITLDRSGALGDILQPYGTGVEVLNGGTFIMNGDVTIEDQRVYDSDEAAGVHVRTGGTFIMNGGTITDNIATSALGGSSQAGGVFIEEGAIFSMSGDSDISSNYVQFIFSFLGRSEVNFGGAGAFYTVCFDQNDGSGSKYYQLIQVSTTTQLKKNTYVREGYSFKNWNVREDGRGTSYANEASVKGLASTGETITLYAQWDIESYTLRFDTAGGSPSSISPITARYGASISVPKVTKAGYEFTGWLDDSGNLYTSLSTMPDCGDSGDTITLTAQWFSDLQYTVSIPEVITVNSNDQTAKISAELVSFPAESSLTVVLNDKTTLKHKDAPRVTLEYVLYADGWVVDNAEVVATFSLGQTDAVTMTAELASNAVPEYSGTYVDTVTFTVSVETTTNT